MTEQSSLLAPRKIIRPLVVSTDPAPGEYLSSVLVRSCEANRFGNVSKLLNLIGLNALASEAAPFTFASHAKPIAQLIGTTTAAIESRMHPLVRDSADRFLIHWYGGTIERQYVEGSLRRYAPRSLEQGAHFKALWSVRLLDYCPTTMELLHSTCPACSRLLRWRGCRSLLKCNSCGASLLTAESRVLPPELHEAARLGADLVSTSGNVRASALSSLPAPFNEWPPADALAGVLALGEAQLWLAESDPKQSSGTAAAMVAGLEFARQWPDSMAKYLKDATAKSRSVSVREGLGPLSKFFSSNAKSAPIRDFLRANISACLGDAVVPTKLQPGSVVDGFRSGMLTTAEAVEKLGIPYSHLRRLEGKSETFLARHHVKGGAALYDEDAILRLKESLRSSLNQREASRSLGVPQYCLEALVSANLIAWEPNRDATLVRGSNLVSRATIDTLQDKVRRASAVVESGLSLRKAMQRRGHPDDWVFVLKGILCGRIKAQVKCGERLPLSDTIFVRFEHVATIMSGRDVRTSIDGVDISCSTAAQILGGTGQFVAEAVNAGLIDGVADRQNYRVSLQSVLNFQKRFIFAEELRETFGQNSMAITAELRSVGLTPERSIYRVNIWHRSAVEEYLRERQAYLSHRPSDSSQPSESSSRARTTADVA